MNPLVSVIVVNHNRGDLLRQCLNSILSQSYNRLEIVVVDNGSSDNSLSVVKSFPDPKIKLMTLDQNYGFARGNNVGIKEAQGELIALLNNDAVADEHWIECLVEAMQSGSQVGMCASKILFFETEIVDKVGHLLYLDGQNRGRGTGVKDKGQYESVEEVLFPDACAALYRRRMLEEVGYFDEQFFAYGDDADLGIRSRWRGWKCLYVPEALAHHHHSSTVGRFSPQKVYWVERNRLWLAMKNFPLPLLVLNPFFTLYRWLWNALAALLRRGAAGHFRRNESFWVLFLVVARAYCDGLIRLGEILRKRRIVRQTRRISDFEFYRLVFRHRISARTLAFHDTDFYQKYPI